MRIQNIEFEYEEFEEIINYITASKKVLKKNRLDDSCPRILLEEGANTYEYKY